MGGVEGWGYGVRDADCHSQCAHWLRNDRVFYKGCGGMSGGRTEASAPTDDKKCGKTGRRGRRPLRIGCKRCGGRATARVAPTEGHASISYTYIIKQYFFAMSRKFFAAEVNLRQRRGIFRWDREGCGPGGSPPAAAAGARGQGAYGRFFMRTGSAAFYFLLRTDTAPPGKSAKPPPGSTPPDLRSTGQYTPRWRPRSR